MIDVTPGRTPRSAHDPPAAGAPHAALLIDFDNVTLGIRSDLQTQLKRLLDSTIIKGKVSVQRAYADWRRYPQYIVPLSEASIDLIFAPAFGANKKNATDIRLAIDALELVFIRPEIGTYILLSGDSDFSALVLKLKEYGKYVIGVGLRESSSDLLVQNCDEYFSYSELTGLKKTSDVEGAKRDPWELVVEAVQQMRVGGDVMRSDRLKQVMLTIDPSFEEKDAGFNRFSKFVLEAGRRGLLALTKLDNGQHEVDIGPNANVMPSETPAETPAAEPPSPPKKSPARSRRRKPPRRTEEAETAPLTLTKAFELLTDSLRQLGATGDQSTDAEQVRERMVELSGNEADPTFEPNRFPRVLRQAHDAGLIDLIKGDDEVYLLKLNPEAERRSGTEPAGESTPSADKAGPDDAPQPKKRSRRTRTTSRASRPSSRTSPKDEPTSDATPDMSEADAPRKAPTRARRKRATPKIDAKPAPADESPSSGKTEAPTTEKRRVGTSRRRGSKGGEARAPRPAEPTVAEQAQSLDVSIAAPTSSGRRSIGARRGSKGGRVSAQKQPTESVGDAPPSGPPPSNQEVGSTSESSPPRGSLWRRDERRSGPVRTDDQSAAAGSQDAAEGMTQDES